MLRLAASRGAELDADAAAAEAFGAAALVSALSKIDASEPDHKLRSGTAGQAMSHAMINDGRGLAAKSTKGWFRVPTFLRTHPTLERRVAALEKHASSGGGQPTRRGSLLA